MEITPAQVFGIIGSLAGAIAALWLLHVTNNRTQSKQQAETWDELKRVRKLRDEDARELRELTGEVGELKGTREGYLAGVEKVSAEVLDEIRKLRG